MSPRDAGERLGRGLLVALLAATLATGILVYRARTADLALEVPRLDRLLGEHGRAELPVTLEFFVRFSDEDARVEIVGTGDRKVRTFAEQVPLAEDERIRCAWDGLDDAGEPVSAGNYRLRVVLPAHGRDMVFPLRIRARRPPPAEPLPGTVCERVADGTELR